MRPGMLRALVVALFVVITSAVVGAAPGEARCLAADVIVHWSGGPDQAVLTDGQCLVPTPFGAFLRVEQDVRAPAPSGAPSGAYVELWMPMD